METTVASSQKVTKSSCSRLPSRGQPLQPPDGRMEANVFFEARLSQLQSFLKLWGPIEYFNIDDRLHLTITF